jgi:hypothetical protein
MCYMSCLSPLQTYLLTDSMQQSPSWEANRFLVSQEIPRILWNPKVHSSLSNLIITNCAYLNRDTIFTSVSSFKENLSCFFP